MSLAGESFLWMDSDGEMPNSVERDQEMVPNICKVTSIQLMYTSQLRQGRDTNSAQVNYFNIYNIVYIYMYILCIYPGSPRPFLGDPKGISFTWVVPKIVELDFQGNIVPSKG